MSLPCPTPGCTRTMPGHLYACRACSTRLIRDLADVPSLASNLDTALARQSRIGERGGPRGTETALPWDQRAAEASAVLRSALVGWVRVLLVDADRPPGPVCRACHHPSCAWIDATTSPADTMPELAHWLLRQRARLLAHPAVPEAVDEITDAVRQARRAIDLPPGRIYAGPCNQCGADLLAKPGHSQVICHACHLEYDVDSRQEWMRAQVDGLLGSSSWVAAVATTLGVPVSASLIRLWAKRGKLSSRGSAPPLNPGGEPRALYRVSDVITVATHRTVGPAR